MAPKIGHGACVPPCHQFQSHFQNIHDRGRRSLAKSECESFMTTDTEGNVIHIFGRKLTPINRAKILYSHDLVAVVPWGVLSDPDGPGLGLG